MKIPASFKIGILEYKVYLTEKIEVSGEDFEILVERHGSVKAKRLKNAGIIFGLCDSSAQTIWIATKDIQGNDLSKERMVSTFYHELAHAVVGETAYNEANRDEIFIEALGKNLYSFCNTISEEDATLYIEEPEIEEDIEEKPIKKSKK